MLIKKVELACFSHSLCFVADSLSSLFSGAVRNVFFPFDIVSDTPIDVANEMVKELEIMDWQPSEIANMIDGEISGLIPDWKAENPHSAHLHVLNYQEDDYDHQNLFSPSSSSQVSALGSFASHRTAEAKPNWIQGIVDAISLGHSFTSFIY